MRFSHLYAAMGVLLGMGAPLGSLALHIFIRSQDPTFSTLAFEWHSASYYYVYMTIGSVITFGIFGYVLGRRNETLSNLSMTDGLTGAFNHRYLHEQLTREIQRSDRAAAPLTCLMLDIDDFKKVNDQHGHPFGDHVLATAARIIRASVRQIDIVGRYGGEEFLVIMPQTTGEMALPIAERILEAVRDHPFPRPGDAVRTTVSIGLATYPAPSRGVNTKDALLSAADQALYQAKRAGKNRAVVWEAGR
jgi:two-component system, cell cycle response regulator